MYWHISRTRRSAAAQGVSLALIMIASTSLLAQVPIDATDIEVRGRRADSIFASFRGDEPGCAISIDRRGQILHAAGYGLADLEHGIPIRPTTVFRLGSLSKQFTAAAVLLLARQGRLSLDDAVRSYLPWVPRYERPITLRDLIHQTSGLRDILSLWALSGRDPEDHLLRREVEAAIGRQRALNHPEGTRYAYSNTNYYLLARVVEAVDGRSFRQFLADELFAPLQMQHSGVVDDYGLIIQDLAENYAEAEDGTLRRRMLKTDLIGASSAYSTVIDMARWNAFLAGSVDGPGGVGFVNAMFTVEPLPGGEESVYAFGLRLLERRGLREISHGGTWGGYRVYFRHYPSVGLGITVLCNQLELSPYRLSARLADIYLGDLATGPIPEEGEPPLGGNDEPDTSKTVAAEQARPLVGRYYSPELDAVHEITYSDGALWIQAGWQEPVRLSPDGEDSYGYEGTTWTFRFENGRVAGLRMDSGRVRGVEFEVLPKRGS